MSGLNRIDWEIVAALSAAAVVCAALVWLLIRRRPTEEEIERRRRHMLVQSGRLVDGMLLDIVEVEAEDGRTLTLLVFNYRSGGVDYSCSQDITAMRGIVNAAEVRVGFPCTVRYQPGNSQNSIVVAEAWSGLRDGLPQIKEFENPEPVDTSHLKGKKGKKPGTKGPKEQGLGTRD